MVQLKASSGKLMKWAEITVVNWVESPWQPSEREKKEQGEGQVMKTDFSMGLVYYP